MLAYGRHALRPLPWRATRDPWAVLVSELMLQQTQAGRVVEPWRAFLERFPSPSTCAAASLGEVLVAWAGLGYNRRAAHLHAAATAMVERHGGQVPRRLEDLLALPGVGPYTARAVAAFAYEDEAAVVDVNVARVLARAVAGAPLSPAAAQALADRLLVGDQAWQWNQSLLEIGALACTARRPRCDGCPIERRCRWRRSADARPDPAAPATRQSPFIGSDRQGRGRLVDALRRGSLSPAALPTACGWPDDPTRARRVADDLEREGLVRRGRDGRLRLA